MAKNKKTLSNWLNNRHILIIQNEEDFSHKATYNFTYARIVFFAFLGLGVIFLLSFYLVNTILAQWFDSSYAERETRKDLVAMSLSLDSLASELENRDLFIQSIRKALEGEAADHEEITSEQAAAGVQLTTSPNSNQIDSLFKSQFETGGDFLLNQTLNNLELRQTYLFSPISGYVSQAFDPKNEHYGIDVVSKKDEPVKCIADGTVIFSSWTQDAGNVIAVQHKENLISVYKHNSALTKEVGNFITAGEILAIIGNTGELTNGPHLHFELWYNGNAVNPEDFIVF
uniref:M23 family metallopeptidase n=1 Tax=Roseivirga sp. TaxID=1964215 RepID=UPI004047EF65